MVKTALVVNQEKPLLNPLKTSSVCIQTQPPYLVLKISNDLFHQSWHSWQCSRRSWRRAYNVHDTIWITDKEKNPKKFHFQTNSMLVFPQNFTPFLSPLYFSPSGFPTCCPLPHFPLCFSGTAQFPQFYN